MSAHPALFLLLVAVGVGGCAAQSGVVISRHKMEALPDNTPWHRVVYLNGIPVRFEFEKTSKGNGMLRFPGGAVGNYDAHNDGITFQPCALDTRLTDSGDLDFSGVGVRYDDRGERELERRPVHAVYRFVPSTRKFIRVVSDEWITERQSSALA